MNTATHRASTKGRRMLKAGAALSTVIALSLVPIAVANASTTEAPLGLMESLPFGAYATDTVTSDGTSRIAGNVGSKTSVDGFSAGDITGTVNVNDAGTEDLFRDVSFGYNEALNRVNDATISQFQMDGASFSPGVWATAGDLELGNTTIQGDADDVVIFKVTSDLIFKANAVVTLEGGITPDHVYWISGSGMEIRSDAQVAGTFFAQQTIIAAKGSHIQGSLYSIAGGLDLTGASIDDLVGIPVLPTDPTDPTDPTLPPTIPAFVPKDQSAIGVGAGNTYSAFGGMLIRNAGASTISGDVGSGPSQNITGLETSDIGGSIHRGDAHALAAGNGFGGAYLQAEARAVDVVLPFDLTDASLAPGTYSKADLTVGKLNLVGDAKSVFVFNIENGITFAPDAVVTLTGGVMAENVIWFTPGSIFTRPNASVSGIFLADDVIDTAAGTSVNGRLFARAGDLVMDSTTINSLAVAPVDPAEPTDPTTPVDPTDPTTPVDPTTPTVPVGDGAGSSAGSGAGTVGAPAPAVNAVLAATGADIAAPGIAAGLLLAFGGLLYVLSRRGRNAPVAAHRA